MCSSAQVSGQRLLIVDGDGSDLVLTGLIDVAPFELESCACTSLTGTRQKEDCIALGRIASITIRKRDAMSFVRRSAVVELDADGNALPSLE
ncbi:hypothetical protein PC118_g4392 [Phytophthora cactorum]|uniref:Uncharacterized protein n=1 Tax=Phytophthora cactorum TaxID=29920 RepID=A0A8T1GF45_9STRA|nr:hypothetical protein PC111_g5738 [Phytophthora cactorum]KAG2861543.1 hypothetical protein PC113_g7102 [Phytophthora cactorum]KAG2922600.1 hypothetical protein PC114_g5205 [Phytophthora cactorum]KAG2950178.1 hypothetical protein PC117_g4626 [Phytophthora cactorum]KAG2992757.1 hypothetical protein PC118_g4392 [Phytophthora cactorum]